MIAALPHWHRHVGLHPTTRVPEPAEQIGLAAVLLPRLARVQWSTDLDAIERVLGFLRGSAA